MKTCISWTKVCTNVNFHDHEEVLTIIVSDLWLSNDLTFRPTDTMYAYFEDEIYNY